MIKRILTALAISLASASMASAQTQMGILNHLGADLSISTTGLSIELASPITEYLQVRAGLSYIPAITFNASFDGTAEVSLPDGIPGTRDFSADVKADLSRAQGDIILNVYPFGHRAGFFVAGGAYFGGKKAISLDGHSDEIAELQRNGTLKDGYLEIGDYKLRFEDNGNIRGGLVVNNVRPYAGIGFGRPCPGHRLGFVFELGVQFMGKAKVCQGANLEPIDISNINNDDDWQKWMDKISVYPVLKFTLSGRLF